MPAIPIEYALAGCAATCTLYAIALCSRWGKSFTLNSTEWSVVVGVLLVLAWTALWDVTVAGWMLAFFVAGGAPMILRSYYLRRENDKTVIAYLRAELAKRTNDSDGAE